MPTFNVYCKSAELTNKLGRYIISDIPSYFDIVNWYIGIPKVTIGDASDPNWNGFPMPVNKGDVYIFDDIIPALALGGAYEMRCSIRVREEDTDEVITLRIWHELLHAVGQPADDMVTLASEWQTAGESILWYLWKLFNQQVDIPFWQRKFYAWLTARAEMDPLL